MAYLTRIRVEGEGESASALEARFAKLTEVMPEAVNGTAFQVQQVIEQVSRDDALMQEQNVWPWYRGRIVYAVEIDDNWGDSGRFSERPQNADGSVTRMGQTNTA